jgi:SAM-dependent methyltransferase
MTADNTSRYWDTRYSSIGWREVSWFQDVPEPSKSLIDASASSKADAIVDVGGGASLLVDALITDGYADVTVVDLSEAALLTARERVPSSSAHWVHADIRTWVPDRTFDIWHDRAAYHFLTDPAEQQRYWNTVRSTVKAKGTVIIATFAEDGPEMCSGLPIQRYSPQGLIEAMGDGFVTVSAERQTHITPSGAEQKFVWIVATRTE